ncbi:hypothetical protein DLD77_10600 [Chitinophaga alhagiae]|uniref:Uncharacterized protein n=2 Tax=Chitinophaga alhagiae TaxID=2203219 RepID=A0ABM6WE11_9BACT|nr:hypothetical protein DLD77_10600 [Chitinophaga alhagiae]
MLAFVLPACKKNKKDATPTEKPGQIKGMGDQAGTPEGTPFELPANISLAGKIRGSQCDTVYERGSGAYVDVCIALFNSGGTDITLVIPAGLVILADEEEYQHGMVVQETRILLKAGQITRCTLGAYCINASKSSSSSSTTYAIGPITGSVLIRELLDLLKNKKINVEDYPADDEAYSEAVGTVQSAVWGITDFDGLQYFKEEILKLPNK